MAEIYPMQVIPQYIETYRHAAHYMQHLKGQSTTSHLIMMGTQLQHSSELSIATDP